MTYPIETSKHKWTSIWKIDEMLFNDEGELRLDDYVEEHWENWSTLLLQNQNKVK
jgi:hypothetical protein